MENNQNENTAAEAAASQERLIEAQVREIEFLRDKIHYHHDNVATLMNTLRFTIEHQIKTYNLINARMEDRGIDKFQPLDIYDGSGFSPEKVREFLTHWRDQNSHEFESEIDDAVEAKLEIDTNWGDTTTTIEVIKNIDGSEIVTCIVDAIIEAWGDEFNG
jgi:hypothetical protein